MHWIEQPPKGDDKVKLHERYNESSPLLCSVSVADCSWRRSKHLLPSRVLLVAMPVGTLPTEFDARSLRNRCGYE